MPATRKYTLASSDARMTVDLREFEDIITQAVLEVMPHAMVQVEENCYYVSPVPSIGNAIRIGRSICKSSLGEYCIQIPKLFTSVKIKEVTPVVSGNESVQTGHLQPFVEKEVSSHARESQLHGGHH